MQPEPPQEPKKDDWFQDIVKRSTGLPEDVSKGKPEKSPWAYAGVGMQFAGTTAIFALIGWYLDHRFGWTPWGLVGCTAVGFVGGIYLLIKESLKNQ